jgi:hypothetical protein
VLKYAFAHPFLLHQLLAVSALHFSTLRPAQESFYRDEATRLQSQALGLFNGSIQDLNSQTIIPAFLFSSLLGLATFFVTFHEPPSEAVDWVYFETVVQSIRLLQGVRAILHGWWPFLIASDIKDVIEEASHRNLEWNDDATKHLEAFRAHVIQSPGLTEHEASVCDEATKLLVWAYKFAFPSGLDPSSPSRDEAAARHATAWLVVVPAAYTDLLVQRRPEALLILGHFAVILHRLRASWNVGGAGQHLLSVVEYHLEESWHTALSWPRLYIYQGCLSTHE